MRNQRERHVAAVEHVHLGAVRVPLELGERHEIEIVLILSATQDVAGAAEGRYDTCIEACICGPAAPDVPILEGRLRHARSAPSKPHHLCRPCPPLPLNPKLAV